MPHYRTRPMLVARGVQPVGPDRRAPCRPLASVTEASAAGKVDVELDLDVDADVDADDRETSSKRS